MVKIIRISGYVLIGAACALILSGLYGIYIKEGFGGVQQTLSPFNVINWLFTAATLAPGYGLIFFANRLEKRKNSKVQNPN